MAGAGGQLPPPLKKRDLRRVACHRRNAGPVAVLRKDPRPLQAHTHRRADRKIRAAILFAAEFRLQRFTASRAQEFDANLRADDLQIADHRTESARVPRVWRDLDIVRPHVDQGGLVRCCADRIVRRRLANHDDAVLDASVKTVHIAEKLAHERGSRVFVDFLRRADLLDLAVIETPTPGKPLSLNKEQNQGIGDRVVAIGNPRGLEGTVSEGIISSLRPTEDFKILQITAPISPGSSGGPLFDAEGRVIGVTTATIVGGQNLNFAVPILLLDRLEKGGAWEPQKIDAKLQPERGNAGLAMTDFVKTSSVWDKTSYTVQNETKNDIKNLAYLLVFKNVETGKIVHFELFMDRDAIPAGLAKRFNKEISRLSGLTTDRYYLDSHARSMSQVAGVITAEFRTLSYEIVRQQKDTVLDFLEKN